MKFAIPALFVFCLPLCAQDRYVSLQGKDTNPGTAASPWRTVTHAASASPSGARIHVGPGVFGTAGFLEGIEVKAGKKLTILGSGLGRTVLQANASFRRTVPYRGGTRTWSGPILVHGVGTRVDLRDLTLDAMRLGAGVAYLTCALYSDGASGSLVRCELRNAGANPPNGAQTRVGFIAVGKNAANPSTILLESCWIHDWNKVGVVLGGDGLKGTVRHCVVEGAGPLGSGKAAQNGIQLGTGGGGFVVQDNLIRDIWYTPSSWNAVGVLVYQTASSGLNLITHNRILDCKTGFYLYTPRGGTTKFDSNRIGGCGWGLNVWTNGGSAAGNVIGAQTSVYVSSAGSFPMSGNAFSDFRTNSGWPSKFIAVGNPAIQDLSPSKKFPGLAVPVPVSLGTGTGPADMATGDFNGDGKLDLAIAMNGANRVTVRFGSGGTDFTSIPAKSVTVPGGPLVLATGEFSGAKGLDLAVACRDGTVRVLKNDGKGGFTAGAPFDLDGTKNDAVPTSLASGQIDGVFQDDLAVGYQGDRVFKDGGIVVLTNKAGVLSAGAAVPGVLREIREVLLVDLDKDGKLELCGLDVSTNRGTSDRIQIWKPGTTAGTFTGPTGYAIGKSGSGLAAGDLDLDGRVDLVAVTSGAPGGLHVYLGRSGGGFAQVANSPFRVDADAVAVSIEELQDDTGFGRAARDVVVLHATERKVTRLRNFRRGAFEDVLAVPAGLGPRAFAWARLDGDALPDLVVLNQGAAAVQVLLGDPLPLAREYGAGCAGSGGRVPAIFAGGLPSRPELGASGFRIGLRNGRPLSIAGLFLSTRGTPNTLPCKIQVGTPFYVAGLLTDGFGDASSPLPIPVDPKILGAVFHGQWVVIDNGGGFFRAFALSEGMRFRVGR